ncbi:MULTISPECIES: SUKH-4 family immunity protein [unclassified Bacillus (in: firmicutes)]|uniref:SUKH-4 family immunity protein n=1 Tax=unclassified Bacillus (in: firmicutes) TaxID=185979 RepID=UPI0008ECFE44|nr:MULTISPECIES: SUKH-4 family immunity protein [unclassified Bacillus (in: firmicutes)]SFH95516.1 SUKH-4 immunity protein [Bacillus sp. 71mf]SFS95032.1 SUKH-4 immunity protein [Bacillus sp. 103mf]
MILPEEFNEKWDVSKNGPLIKFNYEHLVDTDFSDEVKRFLSIGGLPENPAPYLEFISSQALLKSITSILNIPEEFQKYWFLGSTGSGDPICIIEKKENVMFLNNSDGYKEEFINSSLSQFAECLLVYSRMIDKAIQTNGEDAFINNDIPQSVINWLREELERIDPKCMEKGCFWFTEIGNLYE